MDAILNSAEENPKYIFVPIGEYTKIAFQKIENRLGVTSGKMTLSTQEVEDRIRQFYNNTRTLLLIPSGNSEPEGWSQVGLREAVVKDIPEIVKKNMGLNEANSRLIARDTKSKFSKSVERIELKYSLSEDGQLIGERGTASREPIGTILSVDTFTNVRSATFIYPDFYTAEDMKGMAGNPYNYQMKFMASMMHHNLKVAHDNKKTTHVKPFFQISNINYNDAFELEQNNNNKRTISRTLWESVKKQNPNLLY